MELRQLHYFLAVADAKHFGRAAEALHMTQPPLSQQIALLERDLGARLFERSTRRVELTEAGRALYETATAMVNLAEIARHEVEAVASGRRGVVGVGVIGSAMYRQLPMVADALRVRLPGARLEIVPELFTAGQKQLLRQRKIDIGLVRNASGDDEITTRVLQHEPLVVAVPGDDTIGTAAGIEDLLGRTILTYPTEISIIGQTVQHALIHAAGRTPDFHEVSHTSSMLALVAARTGVAILPESATDLHLPGVRYAELPGMPDITFQIAYRTGEVRPLVLEAVRVIEELFDARTPSARGARG